METDKLRVLLVGSGFIGTALANRLLQSGYFVRIISRHVPDIVSDSLEKIEMELSEAIRHPELWKNVETVIYTLHRDRPNESQYDSEKDTDFDLMQNVLTLLNGSGCSQLIYLSSGGAVYGEPQTEVVEELHPRKPVSSYGESKKRLEDLLITNSEHASFNTVVLRPSNVYGNQPDGHITGIVNHLITAAKHQQRFTIWGDGQGQKGYLHIDDLNELILRVISQFQATTGAFNVCSEEYYTPRQLVQLVRDFGYELNCHFAEKKAFDVCQIRLSGKKARETFGWKPKHLLKEYMEFRLKNR